MKTSLTSLLALVIASATMLSTSGCQDARAMETLNLDEHDHILAESPGCQLECRLVGATRRSCVIKDFDCKAVCMDVPECNVPGRISGMPRVCAIMRTR